MKPGPRHAPPGPPQFGHAYLLPLAVAVIQVVGTSFAAHGQPERRAFDAVAIIFLAAGPAALVLRHRYPDWVLGFVLAVTLGYFLLDYPRGPIFLSLIVALATAVMAGRRIAAITS